MIDQSDLDNMWNNLKGAAGYSDTDNPSEAEIAESIASKLSQEMLSDWDVNSNVGFNTVYWGRPYIYPLFQELHRRAQDSVERGKAWIDANIPEKYRAALWLAIGRSVNAVIFKFLEGSLPPQWRPVVEGGKVFFDTLISELLASENLSPEDLAQQTQLLKGLTDKIALIAKNLDSKITTNTSILEQVLVSLQGMGLNMQQLLRESEEYQAELKEMFSAFIKQVQEILNSIPQEIKDEIARLYTKLQQLEQQHANAEEIRKTQDEIAKAEERARIAIQQRYEKYANAIADIENIGQIINAFIVLFGDPKTAYLYSTILEGTIKIVTGLTAIAANLPNIAGAGALSPYAAIAVGLLMIVTAIIKARQPSPEEVITKYIIELSKQINTVRSEMHTRFDRLEEMLSDLYRTALEQFTYLATLTMDNTQLLRELQLAILLIQTKLENLERVINERFQELYHLDLVRTESDAFRAWAEYSTQDNSENAPGLALRNVTEENLFSFFNQFSTWAAAISADPALNRHLPPERPSNPTELHGILASNQDHMLVNLLAEYMYAKGTSLIHPLMSNPVAYQQSTRFLIKYLWQAQAQWRIADVHQGLFISLANSGIDILNFFSLVKINHNLFARLLQDYHSTLLKQIESVDSKFINKKEKLSAQKSQLIDELRNSSVMSNQLFTAQLIDKFYQSATGTSFYDTWRGFWATSSELASWNGMSNPADASPADISVPTTRSSLPWWSIDNTAFFYWWPLAVPSTIHLYRDAKTEEQIKEKIFEQVDIDETVIAAALDGSITVEQILNSALTRILTSENFKKDLDALNYFEEQSGQPNEGQVRVSWDISSQMLTEAKKTTVYELFQKPPRLEDKNKAVKDLLIKIAEEEAKSYIKSQAEATDDSSHMQLEVSFLLLEKYFKIAFKNNLLSMNIFNKFKKIHKLIIEKKYLELIDELPIADKRIANIVTKGLAAMVRPHLNAVCSTLYEAIKNEVRANRTLHQNGLLPTDYPDLLTTVQQIIQFLKGYFGYDFLSENGPDARYQENANYIIAQDRDHVLFEFISPQDFSHDVIDSMRDLIIDRRIDIPQPDPRPRPGSDPRPGPDPHSVPGPRRPRPDPRPRQRPDRDPRPDSHSPRDFDYGFYPDEKIQDLIQDDIGDAAQLFSPQSDFDEARELIEEVEKTGKKDKYILPIKHNSSEWSIIFITVKNKNLEISYFYPEGHKVPESFSTELKSKINLAIAYFKPVDSAPAIIELSRQFANDELKKTIKKNGVIDLNYPIAIKPLQDANYKIIARSLAQAKIIKNKTQKLNELLDAITIKDTDSINTLLKQVDVNAKHPKTNITPLHHAAVHSNAKIIKLLLAAGADPRLRADGQTPCEWAAVNDRPDLAILLKQAEKKNTYQPDSKQKDASSDQQTLKEKRDKISLKVLIQQKTDKTEISDEEAVEKSISMKRR